MQQFLNPNIHSYVNFDYVIYGPIIMVFAMKDFIQFVMIECQIIALVTTFKYNIYELIVKEYDVLYVVMLVIDFIIKHQINA